MDNIKEGLQDVVKLASPGWICFQAVCKGLDGDLCDYMTVAERCD